MLIDECLLRLKQTLPTNPNDSQVTNGHTRSHINAHTASRGAFVTEFYLLLIFCQMTLLDRFGFAKPQFCWSIDQTATPWYSYMIDDYANSDQLNVHLDTFRC